MSSNFLVVKKDEKTGARAGVLKTAHGEIETPAYTIVGTHAEVRCLSSADLKKTKTQMIIANTYHLWKDLGEKLDNFEGLHKKMNWQKPIMTDSGGFQVFSLGFVREHKVSKVASIFPEASEVIKLSEVSKVSKVSEVSKMSDKNLTRITENGVYFTEDGEEKFLNAELSIQIQKKLGADIIFAFDECTSPLNDYEYTKQAMERTHRWAKRSLTTYNLKQTTNKQQTTDRRLTINDRQLLYGIVQGGEYRDLREESAKFIGSLPFDGFAIGGSLGKSRSGMFDVIKWSVPYLPAEKPRHLLGIGRIEDLFEAVELGIDTFDCVIPTREARHGALWTKTGRFDIKKRIYADNKNKIQDDCECQVCGEWNIKRKDLYELFKAKDKNNNAARYATIHNVYFFNDLMEKIREAIKENKFRELKMNVLRVR